MAGSAQKTGSHDRLGAEPQKRPLPAKWRTWENSKKGDGISKGEDFPPRSTPETRREEMSSSESLTQKWLRQHSASYPAQDRVYSDLDAAIATFPTIRPKSDIYTYDDGRTQLLLCLHGLLPITFRNATYNIPIALWITKDYPREPPISYVVPTGDMLVRPGRHVDVSGKCVVEYMQHWVRKSEGCNIVALIEALQLHFSREPPLYAKPKESGPTSTAIASSSTIPAATAAANPHYAAKPPPPLPTQIQSPQVASPPAPSPILIERPPLPPKPSTNSDHIRNNTQSIRPLGPYHADNTRTQFSPVNPSVALQSNVYNPLSPANSTPLLFSNTPVQSPPPPPPLLALAPPNPSGYGIQLQSTTSPPPPPTTHPVPPPPPPPPVPPAAPPVHVLQTIAHQAPTVPVQQPSAAPHPVAPAVPAPNLMDEELPEPQVSSQIPYSVTSEFRPPRPPNPELLQLHARVHEKISTEVVSLTQALAVDAERLRAIQTDLLAGEPAVKDEMARLEAVQVVCRNVAERLRGPVGMAENNVSELRRKGDPEVDELVCATTIVHNQLIDLIAEDNAIEDTIYHLHRALNTGRIDLERFLRTTRALAEEQFMKRALIEKIKQGISRSLGSTTHDQSGWYWS